MRGTGMRVWPEDGAGRAARIAVLCAVLAGVAPAAFAAMPGDRADTFRFSIGGMAADSFTEAALSSSSAGIGATIDFEDVFDLPVNKKVGRLAGYWHYVPRQFFDFGFVEISRTGEKSLEQDVEWGDFTFGATTDMETKFRTRFPYAAWRYSFLNLEQVRISGSAGISYLGLLASLEGNGNITGPSGPVAGSVKEEESIDFPVPLLGLQIDWALNKQLMVEMYIRTLYINGFGLRGGISENALRMHWYYAKHFGVAGGIDKESIDIKEYKDGDKEARFRYEVSGFSFYLDFAF
jgi:hypothetical protein